LLLYSQHVIEILHGLASCALSEIVEARNDNKAAAGLVQCETDVAKIGVCDVLQLRQCASGPNADHGAAGVELAVKGFDVRSRLRFLEGNVDGGKNAAGEREQVS
jgi:hypothetical protein